MKTLLANRALLGQAARLVIKVGSSSLTKNGALNEPALAALVDVVGAAHARGQEVVLVSSGAVAAGLAPLGFASRPKLLRDQQAASMVGQVRLLAAYTREFSRYGITIGQVLLTPEDVLNRSHYANAQGSLRRLLHHGVVPIVNENDAVVTGELRFGDNDRLAALTAHLVDATALILCTDVDGLYTAPPSEPGAELITEVTSLSQVKSLVITGKGSDVGTGGMRTKVEAAKIAISGGVGALVTSAQNLASALNGDPVGTWFVPQGKRQRARDLWLKNVAQARGSLVVDDGAAAVVRAGGASLLCVGVTEVRGAFARGALVRIVDPHGEEVGRGLVGYSSADVRKFLDDGGRAPRPVVHADDLVRR
ncbi:glutamate 5-kinase [Arcanobacterium wilhelmae]|uniref:Glutamate 5-kinase n=1 Tax=Arcanobacterium wilhelmae TaxID=1803177 RepID=A0ABT9ND70_9ACTO|nr:glutamate 5-kinase [Arcanobacterium wilhelmae]MDP9801643.1 glutamate 5-kinase [Arcanobacterium wilhelmae]